MQIFTSLSYTVENFCLNGERLCHQLFAAFVVFSACRELFKTVKKLLRTGSNPFRWLMGHMMPKSFPQAWSNFSEVEKSRKHRIKQLQCDGLKLMLYLNSAYQSLPARSTFFRSRLKKLLACVFCKCAGVRNIGGSGPSA